MYACAIDLRTLCKELREKCVNSVSKAFLIQGLYLKLAGLARHTSKMHLLRERLINTTDAESQTTANYSIAGLNWTHIRLSHSLTHKHYIEKLCQQNTEIENCLDVVMHQSQNSKVNWKFRTHWAGNCRKNN